MINFFRSKRQQLMVDNTSVESAWPIGRYLKYGLGEIILVVIGILIALQINNWNEDRIEAKQEKSYLQRLFLENQQDLATFTQAMNDLEKGKETIEHFSNTLKTDAVNDSLLISGANDYFKYGSIFPIFTSSTSTFDDLSSTGNLKVISNDDLRDHIVKHYARHKLVAQRIQIATAWALPLDAPFTLKNNIMKFEPSTSFLFPQQAYDQLARELRANQIAYISNAATHYWINNDAIEHLKALKQETSLLINELKTEIGPL